MITSKQILDELQSALKEFGTYSFDDKGPDEVMNLLPIITELKSLTAKQAGLILKEVASSKNERGKRLAESLVSDLDRMPDEWFDELLEVSGLEY